MCYTLRKGASDLTRLGQSPKSQQIGCLFSGLAVARKPSDYRLVPHDPAIRTMRIGDADPNNGDDLLPVYFYCTVDYRAELPYCGNQIPSVMEETLVSDRSKLFGSQEVRL